VSKTDLTFKSRKKSPGRSEKALKKEQIARLLDSFEAVLDRSDNNLQELSEKVVKLYKRNERLNRKRCISFDDLSSDEDEKDTDSAEEIPLKSASQEQRSFFDLSGEARERIMSELRLDLSKTGADAFHVLDDDPIYSLRTTEKKAFISSVQKLIEKSRDDAAKATKEIIQKRMEEIQKKERERIEREETEKKRLKEIELKREQERKEQERRELERRELERKKQEDARIAQEEARKKAAEEARKKQEEEAKTQQNNLNPLELTRNTGVGQNIQQNQERTGAQNQQQSSEGSGITNLAMSKQQNPQTQQQDQSQSLSTADSSQVQKKEHFKILCGGLNVSDEKQAKELLIKSGLKVVGVRKLEGSNGMVLFFRDTDQEGAQKALALNGQNGITMKLVSQPTGASSTNQQGANRSHQQSGMGAISSDLFATVGRGTPHPLQQQRMMQQQQQQSAVGNSGGGMLQAFGGGSKEGILNSPFNQQQNSGGSGGGLQFGKSSFGVTNFGGSQQSNQSNPGPLVGEGNKPTFGSTTFGGQVGGNHQSSGSGTMFSQLSQSGVNAFGGSGQQSIYPFTHKKIYLLIPYFRRWN
jgi:hypothetical protein